MLGWIQLFFIWSGPLKEFWQFAEQSCILEVKLESELKEILGIWEPCKSASFYVISSLFHKFMIMIILFSVFLCYDISYLRINFKCF
jgi:hypothetical protein